MFAIAALDKDNKTFIVYMAFLASRSKTSVHPSWATQIALLIADEAPVTVPAEYSDFAEVFSSESAAELPKYTKINDHPIKLIDDQQPPYELIYSLELTELETLKTYIKTNLAKGFIRLFKSPAETPILFSWKSDGSFRLYVDYWGFNNLTIKNR